MWLENGIGIGIGFGFGFGLEPCSDAGARLPE